jgi:hypothetical protein
MLINWLWHVVAVDIGERKFGRAMGIEHSAG